MAHCIHVWETQSGVELCVLEVMGWSGQLALRCEFSADGSKLVRFSSHPAAARSHSVEDTRSLCWVLLRRLMTEGGGEFWPKVQPATAQQVCAQALVAFESEPERRVLSKMSLFLSVLTGVVMGAAPENPNAWPELMPVRMPLRSAALGSALGKLEIP